MDGSVHCFMLCINAIDDTFHHDVRIAYHYVFVNSW